ncbi:PC4 and SFRS1-interacting protein [Homalodisca vitripennis]|nr:PC4 and SFRS1-interacting protein [Homalodisca vitripennis]
MASNNGTLYDVGVIVFAKIRGHPYWPAVIQDILKIDNITKYSVTFFGDNTTASIKQSDMCLYAEYNLIHGKPKTDNFKNKKFNEALREAEQVFKTSLLSKPLIDNSQNKSPGCEELDLSNTAQRVEGSSRTNESLIQELEMLNNSKDLVEVVHTKIQHFNDVDDLETSLTLAAEAGNALLAENCKLKQDLNSLTLRNFKLAQQITDQHTLSELTYQAKIKELEAQNEALHSRNTLLAEKLTEVENQLSKEKQLQAALENTFEEQDLSKEKIICRLEEKIKQLENTIKMLQSRTDNSGCTEIKVNAIDSETQTNNPNITKQRDTLQIMIKLTKLKCRQDHLESTVKIFQNNSYQRDLHDQTNTTPAKPTSRTPLFKQFQTPNRLNRAVKNSSSKKGNYFSVSLQIAKNKELQEQRQMDTDPEKTIVRANIKTFGNF